MSYGLLTFPNQSPKITLKKYLKETAPSGQTTLYDWLVATETHGKLFSSSPSVSPSVSPSLSPSASCSPSCSPSPSPSPSAPPDWEEEFGLVLLNQKFMVKRKGGE